MAALLLTCAGNWASIYTLLCGLPFGVLQRHATRLIVSTVTGAPLACMSCECLYEGWYAHDLEVLGPVFAMQRKVLTTAAI